MQTMMGPRAGTPAAVPRSARGRLQQLSCTDAESRHRQPMLTRRLSSLAATPCGAMRSQKAVYCAAQCLPFQIQHDQTHRRRPITRPNIALTSTLSELHKPGQSPCINCASLVASAADPHDALRIRRAKEKALQKAKASAGGMLLRRPHSEAELRAKLTDRGHPDDAIDAAIARLQELVNPTQPVQTNPALPWAACTSPLVID